MSRQNPATGGLNTSVGGGYASDPNAENIYRKLELLNQQLNKPATTASGNYGTSPEKKQHFFNTGHGAEINANEAYNLLSGRSIEKNGKWIQFDLNDKDAQGNYRVKEFHAGYGYDLDRILQQLPLKELKNFIEADKLKQDLKQGQRLEVTFLKEGNERRYFIEANPQHKSVNIYDEHSRKISLNTAVGGKIMEAVKVAEKEHVKQEEKQPKKQGLRVS